MRIAQIAPLTEAIPPKLYGGTERVVSWLTEELVALGHDVTLFASGDSQTTAKLEPMWPRALRLDNSVRDPMALHMAMLERVRQRAGEFDILHFHLDYFPFSIFSRQATPFITTMHGRLDLPEHQTVFNAFASVPVISISDVPTPAIAAGALAQDRSSRPAGRFARNHARRSPTISPFSAASRRRRRSTGRSASPSAASCRSRSRRRSTTPIATISNGRSARCSICPASTTSARSATRKSRRS